MALHFSRIALAALLLAAPIGASAQDPGTEPAAAEAAAPTGEMVDGIAAQVGTEVVLLSDVNRAADLIEEQVRAKGGTDADVAMLRSDILDKLIERNLIKLLAKRAEIEATEFEIDDAINSIAAENQMDSEQLKQSVAAEGLAWQDYRARIGEEIVQQKVLNGMVRSRAKVEESQIRRLYDQRYGAMPASGGEELRLLHMAVGAVDGRPASVQAACEKVRRALSRVRAGESFAKVASEVSQAAPDLGWLPQDSLAPWMQSAVAGLEPGQVSNVIELPIGCAVLTLVERRTVEALSYEQAKGPLRQVLAEQAFQEEYGRFIERIRRQTYVDRRGEFAGAGDVASPPPLR